MSSPTEISAALVREIDKKIARTLRTVSTILFTLAAIFPGVVLFATARKYFGEPNTENAVFIVIATGFVSFFCAIPVAPLVIYLFLSRMRRQRLYRCGAIYPAVFLDRRLLQRGFGGMVARRSNSQLYETDLSFTSGDQTYIVRTVSDRPKEVFGLEDMYVIAATDRMDLVAIYSGSVEGGIKGASMGKLVDRQVSSGSPMRDAVRRLERF